MIFYPPLPVRLRGGVIRIYEKKTTNALAIVFCLPAGNILFIFQKEILPFFFFFFTVLGGLSVLFFVTGRERTKSSPWTGLTEVPENSPQPLLLFFSNCPPLFFPLPPPTVQDRVPIGPNQSTQHITPPVRAASFFLFFFFTFSPPPVHRDHLEELADASVATRRFPSFFPCPSTVSLFAFLCPMANTEARQQKKSVILVYNDSTLPPDFPSLESLPFPSPTDCRWLMRDQCWPCKRAARLSPLYLPFFFFLFSFPLFFPHCRTQKKKKVR